MFQGELAPLLICYCTIAYAWSANHRNTCLYIIIINYLIICSLAQPVIRGCGLQDTSMHVDLICSIYISLCPLAHRWAITMYSWCCLDWFISPYQWSTTRRSRAVSLTRQFWPMRLKYRGAAKLMTFVPKLPTCLRYEAFCRHGNWLKVTTTLHADVSCKLLHFTLFLSSMCCT